MSLFGSNKPEPVVATNKQSEQTLFKKQIDLTYVFKVSRRCEPKEVRNLWDLEVRTPTDESFVKVVDADSLSTVIAKMGYIFEQDGL